MCGIAGLYHVRDGRPIPPGLVEAMADRMAHRGPDDRGFFHDGPIGLGMRRLSIIDLTGGAQPIGNEDGSVQVVFNGEIYNHRTLRRDLEALGHRFRTRADTEVIVHGYEQFGDAVLDRLNGMFAIALWDAPRRRLLLARDRLGIKPLYYATVPGGIAFASELKALLPVPGVCLEIDRDAIQQYLAWEYIPAPASPFTGVRKLPAARSLVIDPAGTRENVYWRIAAAEPVADLREAEEGLRAHLERSVRLQLESDVPVGAFLSGGLDSSAMVATLRRVHAGPVRTFSIGFLEGDFDERAHARSVAAACGTDHREEVLRPRCLDLLNEAAGFLDEPFADASVLPTYLVARVARKEVKVALSGDGGDELFGGYDRYKAASLGRWFRGVPARWRGWLARRLGEEAEAHPSKRGSLRRRLRRLEEALTLPLELEHARYMFRGPALLRGDLIQEDREASQAADGNGRLPVWAAPWAAIFRDSPFDGGLARQLEADVRMFLPDDILFKLDRATMAASLEARVPYLDHELVEYAFRIPDRFKLRFLTGKWILRRSFRDRVPAPILRRRKSGFSVPVAAWLRGDLRDLAHDLLAPGRISAQGLFRAETVARLLSEHQTGRADHGRTLWALVMFQLWGDRFGRPLPGPVVPRPAEVATT